MDLKLKDKVAIITGGNKGFGAACAEMLAGEGVNLILTARNEDDLTAVAEKIRSRFSTGVDVISADLTVAGDADKIVGKALACHDRIDILVNCAGASKGGIFWEIEDQVWEDSMALKFHGTVRMIRAALGPMRKQKYGRIVTIAGNTGKQPNSRMLPGGTANAALIALNTGLAQEVAGDGIVMNVLNPGPARTERWNGLMIDIAKQAGKTVDEIEAGFMADIPMDRLAEPEEIARLVTFLASDAAANMTGTSVTADGGWTKGLS